MTPAAADALRRSAAHVVVDDIAVPVLSDEAAHHVFRVLRIRDGEVVSVTDGRGGWRLCRAVSGALQPDTEVVVEDPPVAPVTIGFAVPKLDRPDWIVQKLTEIGVDRIVLLHAERSVVRWDGSRAAKHVAKLERVAIEAVQQSRRVHVPTVDGPLPADQFLVQAVAAEPGGRPLGPSDRVIAIGPEGGWTDRELTKAVDRVALGTNVLRVETAAVVAAVRANTHSA